MRAVRERPGHDPGAAGRRLVRRNLRGVSTRMLIILALLCGLAVLVAFAVQAAQII